MNTTTILVVDDTPDLLDLYAVWLREIGYKVLEARTGRECLRLVQEKLPELVLLDVMLPDVDGIEVCKRIKSNTATAAIPVINISGMRTSADHQAEGLEAGADGYLTKPFERRTLLAHVKALLRMRQTEEALKRSEERFKSAFDNALDAMLIADDDAKCLDANPAACALFGVSKQEMLQRKVSDFGQPGHERELETLWKEIIKDGARAGEYRIYRSDGTTRELEYRATASVLPNCHLAILRDVTQRKEAEEELHTAHVGLEKRVEQRTAELVAANSFLREEIAERKRAESALGDRLRFETFLTELSAAFANLPAQRVDQEIEGWIRRLTNILGIDRVTFTDRDANGEFYRRQSYTVSGVKPLTGVGRLNENFPWVTEKIRLGRVIRWSRIPEDVPEEAVAEREHAIELGLKSNLLIPIIIDDAVVCAVSFASARTYREWPDDIVGRLRLVGEIFANAVVRQRAQASLKQSEERSHLLIEGVKDYAIIMLDPEGNIVSWNEGAKRIQGYSHDEIIGKHFSCFYPPEEVQKGSPAQELNLAKLEGRYEDEGWRIRKDGSRYWCNVVVTALHDELGNLRGFSKVTRDITDRKRVEAALRQSEEQYRELVENINDIIYSTDDKGVVTYISRAVEQALGITPATIIGQPFTKLLHPADHAAALINFQMSALGSSEPLEFRVMDKSGGIRWVRKSSRPVFRGDMFMGTRGLVTDITERKQAEAARVQLLNRLVSAQEEEQRRLSRELHDQTGQSLAALMLGLKSIEDSDQLRDTARTRLRQLQELTNQLAHDVHHLASKLRPTALDDLGLHTALANYVEEWSDRTKISADFHSNGLLKDRLPRQIETAVYRIVQEALTNVAKHANAQNVSVILEYRGSRVQAIIEDDGSGFDTERILTGTEKGRLGLLGMQERVGLVDGDLNIESTPASGTTVIVHIPVSREQLETNSK